MRQEYLIETKYKTHEEDNIRFIYDPLIQRRIFEIEVIIKRPRQYTHFSKRSRCVIEEIQKRDTKYDKKCWQDKHLDKKPSGPADDARGVESERNRCDKEKSKRKEFCKPEKRSTIFDDPVSEKDRTCEFRRDKSKLIEQEIGSECKEGTKEWFVDFMRTKEKKDDQRYDVEDRDQSVRWIGQAVKHI